MSQEGVQDAPRVTDQRISSPRKTQFSADLFHGGPCFGDLSPSETLLDAPSPSPLLLVSLSDSHPFMLQSAPLAESGDLIDFMDDAHTANEHWIPSSEQSSSLTYSTEVEPVNANYSPSSLSSRQDLSQDLPSLEPLVHLDAVSIISLNYSQDISATISQNEISDSPSLPCSPFSVPEDNADLLMLQDSSPNDTIDPLTDTIAADVQPQPHETVASSDPPVNPASSLSPISHASPCSPSSLATQLQQSDPDSSASSLPVLPMPPADDDDFANVDGSFPSSSPISEEPVTTDFPSSSPPPTSSPPHLFSSSPPAMSDSSAVIEEAEEEKNDMSDENAGMLSSRSSSPQDSRHAELSDLELIDQDIVVVPPSSSLIRSSSPASDETNEIEERPETEDMHDNPGSSTDVEDEDQVLIKPLDPPSTESSTFNDDVTSSHKRKREETDIAQPPNPKRLTLASQNLQRKTLIKPFRSPAMIAPKPTKFTLPPSVPEKKPALNVEQLTKKDMIKHRTVRAAGQFKSPLPLALSSSISTAVRPTPTIQYLERKAQVLRRAVKAKKTGEQQTLEDLVKKWTEAGREVAWEVWALVKDQENANDDWKKDSQNAATGKRRFEDSWGWNGGSPSKKVKTEWDNDRNWGWDNTCGGDERPPEAPMELEDPEEKPRETLGTMLRRLGIDPSTFGWNDENEEFVD